MCRLVKLPLSRKGPSSEPSARMTGARFVSTSGAACGIGTGVEQLPPCGLRAKLMYVCSGADQSRSPVQSASTAAPCRSHTHCLPARVGGTRQRGVDVKNITYSPLGALTTFGSCAKTGHTTSRISNGAVSEVVVACTTCEFASQ